MLMPSMSGPTDATGSTEEHRAPELDARAGSEPALIVAFPEPKALALPPNRDPIGRAWFEAQGLADSEISAAHLSVGRAGGSVTIRDLGSRNGTFVDGRRLPPEEPARLGDGAVLRVGRTLMVYRDELVGPRQPSGPIGALVGPFGLRAVARAIDSIERRPPRAVLIEAETGSGKELVAEAVAECLRPGRPRVAVNVAGIPAGVFESTLFGHVAGAFSGSGKGGRGLIAAHDGGVIFLDEIGELPLELQPKLLRFVENGELLPVGADRPVRADVLVVAATNRSLAEMIATGTFRRDLHARLAGACVEIPPLRDRVEDLFAIALGLAARRGEGYDLDATDVEAVERLMLHAWPSNVRELDSVLERVAATEPRPALRLAAVQQVLGGPPSRQTATLTVERVRQALAAHGSQSQAARALGVTRGQLLRFLKANAGEG